jgi:hypothetical protein
MKRFLRLSRPVVAAACAAFAGGAVVPRTVAAQNGPASKAFNRLFEADPSDEARRFTVFVYQGVTSSTGNQLTASPVPDGPFTGIDPSFSLAGGQKNTAFGVSGGAAIRHFSGQSMQMLDLHGGGGAQFTGRRSGLRLQETAEYSPYYQILNFASPLTGSLGAAAAATPDAAALDLSSTRLTSSADYGYQLTRNLLFSSTYHLRYTRIGSHVSDATENTAMHDVSARLSRQMGRHLVVYGGYGRRFSTSNLPDPTPLKTQDIMVGFDRQQQFSFAQRTTLDISTGSSIIGSDGKQRFILTGTANFRHDITRDWQLDAMARRGVDYLDGLRDPVIADSAQLYVEGPVAPRMYLLTSAAYTSGTFGIATGASRYETYSIATRFRAALTRMMGVYAEYTKFYQQANPGSTRPAGLDSLIDRSAVRFGIVLNSTTQSSRGKQ